MQVTYNDFLIDSPSKDLQRTLGHLGYDEDEIMSRYLLDKAKH